MEKIVFTSDIIRFGPEDKPDLHGYTKKMHKIYDLVEAGKKLEDGGFKISAADREFYEGYKAQFEWKKKQNGGEPYYFPRYDVDIDEIS